MNPNPKPSGGRQLGVLDLAHRWLREHVSAGDICIDATCGRGNDTKLLCELTGETGKVIGFDIQQEALDSAAALLSEHHLSAELHLESHAEMERYAAAGTVSCIVFNFGWLPRGSHEIFKLGINWKDYILLAVCVVVIWAVSMIQEKHSDTTIREMLDKKPFILRWLVFFLLIMAVIIFGIYGSGYAASDFVYMQF